MSTKERLRALPPSTMTKTTTMTRTVHTGKNNTNVIVVLDVERCPREEENLATSFQQWLNDANHLVHSPEMSSFLASSKDVVVMATGTAVRLACMPVTVPLGVAQSAVGLVMDVCNDNDNDMSPLEDAVHRVKTHAIPLVLDTAEKIKNGIGGTVLGMLSPFLSKQETSNDNKDFLERLRLDYYHHHHHVPAFWMRTHDLVHVPHDCIDFSTKSRLTDQAIRDLVQQAMDICNSNAATALSHHDALVEWKPECGTDKLLRQKDCNTETETLIWSGNGFFLARGIVPTSPKDVLDLLWDDDRVSEYNRFCMGRETLLVLEPNFTKIVRSETRVPFTSMSVVLSTLMHIHPLNNNNNEYMIVSRSLTTTTTTTEQPPRNEVLWGVNVMRSVPDKPNHTDLTCLSRVNSNMVPRFLSTRVGIMAIENCFQSMRQPKK